MVVTASGLLVAEAEIRVLADCTPFGTEALQLVEASRKLGFLASRKHTLASINELSDLVDEGLFPIVYVDLWPIRGGRSGQYHSLVTMAVSNANVIVLDPLVGERSIGKQDFQAAWEQMHALRSLSAGKAGDQVRTRNADVSTV